MNFTPKIPARFSSLHSRFASPSRAERLGSPAPQGSTLLLKTFPLCLSVLLLLAVVSTAVGQWGRTADDSIVLPLDSPGDRHSALCSDGNGGCWVAGDIVGLCHLDRLGNLTWGDTALWLEPRIYHNAQLLPADTGSVIVGMQKFEDNHLKVCLNRINLSQELLWGQSGITVDSSSLLQFMEGLYPGPIVGTYLVHWIRNNEDFTGYNPRLQLVNQNGELLWGNVGIETGFGGNMWITTTSDHCVISAQTVTRPSDIAVCKFNVEGECLWTSRFSILGDEVPIRKIGKIESDGEGGIILVYEYIRQESYNDSLISFTGLNATRIFNNGDSLWTINLHERDQEYMKGIQKMYPSIINVGSGRFFAAWADWPHSMQVVCFNIDGEFLWDEPVDIASNVSSHGELSGVISEGGICYVWEDYEPDRSWQLWGQRISIDGERLWGDRGLCIQTRFPMHVSATSDCNEGIITLGDFSYPAVQMMNRNGEIGVALPFSVKDDGDPRSFPELDRQPLIFPNPCNSQLRILFDDEANGKTFRYRIYNLTGRLVRGGIMNGVPYRVEDLSRFPNGEYILQIQTSRTTATKRFSLVK